MRSPLALLSVSILALLSATPSIASADDTFPGRIQANLGLSYTPPCNICHTSPSGFPAPASLPFARALQGHGLVAPDTSNTLEAALSALTAADVDSDCDGVIDTQQLKNGRDPNAPGKYVDGSGKQPPSDPGCANASDQVAYGCGAQLSRAPTSGQGTPWQGAALILAGLGAVLARRR